MARIKIDVPNEASFNCRLRVRITDLNYGGHLGNDAVLRLVHEARVQFLGHFGYTEIEIEENSLIMLDSAIVYKAEAFYNDELEVSVACTEIEKLNFDLVYKAVRISDSKEIFRAKTGMAFFNYQTKKLVFVPAAFKDKMLANG